MTITGRCDFTGVQGNYPMATLPEMLDDLDLAIAWIKDNLVSRTASHDSTWKRMGQG